MSLLIGLEVKKCRIEKGFSQENLASISGLHRTYIGMVERGEKNTTVTSLEKIICALDMKMSTFFERLEKNG